VAGFFQRIKPHEPFTLSTARFHHNWISGTRPGTDQVAPGGLRYSTVEATRWELWGSLLAWPTEKPVEGSLFTTALGFPYGASLDVGLVWGLPGVEPNLHIAVQASFIFEFLRLKNLGLAGSFHVGYNAQAPDMTGIMMAPGLDLLVQFGFLRAIIRYRAVPPFGAGGVAHEARAFLHMQIWQIVLGGGPTLAVRQRQEKEGGYTIVSSGLAIEVGWAP
jgi:hypothetical protein